MTSSCGRGALDSDQPWDLNKKTRICIAGWHYFPDFLEIMLALRSFTFIVAHRYDLWLESFEHVVIDNIGLEFGAYDYYLKNHWDGKSNILFMHDDVTIRGATTIERIIEKCEGLDQAFIFTDERECKENGAKHGRCLYLSAPVARRLLTGHDGIWFDPDNRGYTEGGQPSHCQHFNAGIRALNRTLKRLEASGYRRSIVVEEDISFYKRGISRP